MAKNSGIGENMKKKRLIIIISIILCILVVFVGVSSIFIYEQNFNMRFETSKYFKYELSDFEDLKREKHELTSNKHQNLVGYKYFKDENSEVKGVIVISHGLGGGGHNTYMNYIDYFTDYGYLVFAYDCTGNDESDGDSVRGLPQSLIDLDYVLKYLKDNDEFKDLPIILVGHSWGGYAVSSVLNIHPDVKAVLSIAGFNKTIDIIVEQGKNVVGSFIYIFKPFISFYEFIKFGKYSNYNSLSGYEKSNAEIIIMHSEDDNTISYANSYKKYYDKFKDNNRFHFISFKDRGHNYLLRSEEAFSYADEFNEKFKELYDQYSGSIPETEIEAIYSNLDKSKAFALDENLIDEIIQIFDESIQK